MALARMEGMRRGGLEGGGSFFWLLCAVPALTPVLQEPVEFLSCNSGFVVAQALQGKVGEKTFGTDRESWYRYLVVTVDCFYCRRCWGRGGGVI